MSYFDTATMTISEIGGYGDYELPTDEFARDDRGKRIDRAAGALCDWTYEHLLDAGELGDEGIFKQAHLPRIQRMVAIAMMAQFEHDQEMEAHLIAELWNESSSRRNSAMTTSADKNNFASTSWTRRRSS